MSGKGDKPRPIPDRKKYEDNWDAIFGKKNQKHKQQDMTELNGDGNRDRNEDGEEELMAFHGIPTKKSIEQLRKKFEMWEHYCTVEATKMSVGKGEECNWCGMTEK